MHAQTTKRIAAILALAAMLSTVSSAQEPTPRDAADAVDVNLALMRFADSDRDHSISAREFAAAHKAAAIFAVLDWKDCDADGDGQVTIAELRSALKQAGEALDGGESEEETEALDALASAVPLSVVLDQLASNNDYADEIAALREAVEDLDDDDAVVSYITAYPTKYPRLTPLVKTWGRYDPFHRHWRRSSYLRKHYKPIARPARVKPAKAVKPGVKSPKLKVGVKPHHKPKSGAKPHHKPRSGAKPRPHRGRP